MSPVPRALMRLAALVTALLTAAARPLPASAHPDPDPYKKKLAPAVAGVTSQAATPCVGGMAGEYPCRNVDLMAQMPLNTIGGGNGNDIWGWTDPQTGK